ncbi:hypothetical protein PF010_g31675 [Phytophthora fragariae]|nr:hypothetical protein PR002_g32775 [Phytophthora rubi]KAE9056682.1 hypothetical protein PF010_g31675 [Phytophthora fragariae]KAE9056754.1 hypothetical protein PF007_g31887 [Phytophthora fragariae]KAE9058519.1 hypothetical protein PF006_g32129 [Phytophthora fragariae]KAE9273260.1 hypothetical protein PF008_g29884 [Phytophthora fragariae]
MFGVLVVVLDSKKQVHLDPLTMKTNMNPRRRKKKNPKETMKTARLRPCSGVPVRMLWKQVTAQSQTRFKKL